MLEAIKSKINKLAQLTILCFLRMKSTETPKFLPLQLILGPSVLIVSF